MTAPTRGSDRPAAVAGTFYPDSPDVLRHMVQEHLAKGLAWDGEDVPSPRALVAPHAGYAYSGDIVGLALSAVTEQPKRVVLFGPAHRVPFRGVSPGDFARYVVPTGSMPVDRDAVASLESEGFGTFVPEAHASEHALETLVPFLIERFGEIPIVPMLGGTALPEEAEAAIQHVLEDDDLLIVSTDLSHFLADDVARRKDEATLEAVCAGTWEDIGPYEACGHLGLSAVMILAEERGWRPVVLGSCNSSDAGGSPDRVVGYAAAAYVTG